VIEAGHSASVIAVVQPGDDSGAFFEAMREHRVPYHRIALGAREYLRERRAVRGLLAELNSDVVHTHGYRADVLHRRALPEAGSMSTVHGFTGGDARNQLYEWLQMRALRRANAVVAVSTPILNRLVASGVSPSRTVVIRNSVAMDQKFPTRAEARAVLGIGQGEFVVGWVGRLSAEKGPDVMLAAAESLSGQAVNVSFVGEGPQLEALRRSVSFSDLRHRVRFHGSVADAGRLLPAFDVVVLSSRTEGTPMVLLEAVAAGVPVVATSVGGIPDIVSEREVLLVKPEMPSEIAAAVLRFTREAELGQSLAVAARERMRRELAYDSWIRSYVSVYESVTRERGAGR
jgi:glycosyltransferase involved in cell wall biosynthesis